MKKYTASAFIKFVDHYTKPIPHPVWWRRMLGQKVSYQIGWFRTSYEANVPEKLIREDWFQELIKASLIQSVTNTEKIVYDGSIMLEESFMEEYIATKGSEQAATNHILKNTK
jgi:hypothetical protein